MDNTNHIGRFLGIQKQDYFSEDWRDVVIENQLPYRLIESASFIKCMKRQNARLAGNLISEKRTRLSSDSIQAGMTLRSWQKAGLI